MVPPVFVKLDGKICHYTHGFVSEGHFHLDHTCTTRKRPGYFQTFSLHGWEPNLSAGGKSHAVLRATVFLYDLIICLLPTQNSLFLEGCTLPWACQLHLQGQRGHPGHRSQGHWTPGAPQLVEHQNQPPSVSQQAKYWWAIRDRRHKWIESGTLLTAGLPPRSPPSWGRRRGESTEIHPLFWVLD